jgi:hypothetical protein
VKPLITHRFPLAQTEEAMQLVEDRTGGVIKAAIVM